MSSFSSSTTSLTTNPIISPRTFLLSLLLSTAAGGAVAYKIYSSALNKKHGLQETSKDGLEGRWREIVERKAAAAQQSATSPSSASAPSPSPSPSLEASDSDILLRPAVPSDSAEIAQQMHVSFNTFNSSVGLRLEFPVLSLTQKLTEFCIAHDASVIAVDRKTGEILGSAFNSEDDIIGGAVGCGPWSVKWATTQKGVGRKMIREIIAQSLRHGATSIRLIQISANITANSLYTSLGFVTRESGHMWIGTLSDEVINAAIEEGEKLGYSVREMTKSDIEECDFLHQSALGITRRKTIQATLEDGEFKHHVIVDKKGKIVAYDTGIHEMGHSISSCRIAWKHLISYSIRSHCMTHTKEDDEPPILHTLGRLYPELDRWLLLGGMKIARAVNMMCLGEWKEIESEKFVYASTIVY